MQSKKSLKIIILAFLCCFEAQLKETLQCNVHVSKVVKLLENLVFEIQIMIIFIIQFSAPMAKLLALFFLKICLSLSLSQDFETFVKILFPLISFSIPLSLSTTLSLVQCSLPFSYYIILNINHI